MKKYLATKVNIRGFSPFQLNYSISSTMFYNFILQTFLSSRFSLQKVFFL